MLWFSLFVLFWVFSGLLSLTLFGLLDKFTGDNSSDHEELIVVIGFGGPLSIIVGIYLGGMFLLFESRKWNVKESRILKIFLCYYKIGNKP